jgi:hypothetical protein
MRDLQNALDQVEDTSVAMNAFFISMHIISGELYCNVEHSGTISSSYSFYLSQYLLLSISL